MIAHLVTEFVVDGVAVPQGSKSATVRGGVAVMFDDNKALRAWRKTVTAAAAEAYGDRAPVEGPLQVELEFRLARGKTVRRPMPSVRPDVDKLTRACFDSLTGVVFKDDAQVVTVLARKRYADQPGVHVRVGEYSTDETH